MNTIAAATTTRTTSSAGVPTPAGTRAVTIERYAAALVRADAEHLTVSPNADGSFAVKGYTVSKIGPSAIDLSCTCAGAGHTACKHRAAVARYIRQAARCTGYLHLHAAQPGSNVRTFWCPVCDHEATPKAAAIIAASATGAGFGRQERQKDAWL